MPESVWHSCCGGDEHLPDINRMEKKFLNLQRKRKDTDLNHRPFNPSSEGMFAQMERTIILGNKFCSQQRA